MGRSGNYRPAGAWAHRNTIAPVAVLENAIGPVITHPALAALVPAPDLDRLETQHVAEETEEAARRLVDLPRPMAMMRPAGGNLPLSDKWLARLYAGDRVAKEKKPPVFDHLRSAGPWYVSIDEQPLSIIDGMSQTATVCGGFGEDPVVQGLVEGAFGDTLVTNEDTALGETDAAAAYANTLRQLVPGLPHVTFVASGAEANEKSLALARINCARPQATKVLAFDGSFHGRAYLTLHATHSPSKRAPFELAGYEATFAPFPVWTPALGGEEPQAPSGFYAAVRRRRRSADLIERFSDAKRDPLLAAEVKALVAVHEALASGQYFACIVEPMQSEGGDRYATERFFRALRLLTRFHDTFLLFDEVQVGFALGGPFVWHTRFRLHNRRGQPDYPDAVAFAKRAQVGVVMSRFDDPEPASAHNASLVRGRIHAEMVSTEHNAHRLEKLVVPRLTAIAHAYPHLVSAPRACGYAFAFDLPTPAVLDAFIGQRFWRGGIVFAAGTKTARYRLSDSFLAREIDLLFDSIRRSLSWLDAHPDKKPPAWEDLPPPVAKTVKALPNLRYRQVASHDAMALLPAILDIEYQVYEPARRTPPAEIRAAIEDDEGSAVIAELVDGEVSTLIGFAIGAPLEHSKDVEGPDDDPMLGKNNTMYSVSITVAPGYQSSGIGRRLKEMQVRDAAARMVLGRPRYRYLTGRNRVGRTAEMTHLNRVFGAHVVQVLTGQYEDPEGQAIYYRIPLGGIAPDPALRATSTRRPGDAHDEKPVDLASGLVKVFATAPASLRAAETSGLLYGPAVNKITLMNYATTGMIRALEWESALVPELPHLYLTSSRDEAFDKALRLVKCTRKTAAIAIGLDGGYLGHTVASARSLSDPAVHNGGPAHFAWPRVPHPAVVGTAATIAALRDGGRGGGWRRRRSSEFFYEIVQERTGWVIPRRLLAGAGRAAQGSRPAARGGREHDLDVPQRPRRVRGPVDRPGARPDAVVGRGPDRLPALHAALVRGHAAHAGLDLGRRRAVAHPHPPPAARGAVDRHPRGLRRARSGAVAGDPGQPAGLRPGPVPGDRRGGARGRAREARARARRGAAPVQGRAPGRGAYPRRRDRRGRGAGHGARRGAASVRTLEPRPRARPRAPGARSTASRSVVRSGRSPRSARTCASPTVASAIAPRCSTPPTRTCRCSPATIRACTTNCAASPRARA